MLSWSIYVGNFGKLASYYWPLLSHSSPSIPACHIFWKWPQLQPWISAFWLQIIIPLWLELYSLIIRYADTDGYYPGFHFGVFGFCQGRYWQNSKNFGNIVIVFNILLIIYKISITKMKLWRNVNAVLLSIASTHCLSAIMYYKRRAVSFLKYEITFSE